MVAWLFKDDSGEEFEQDIGDQSISSFLRSPAGGRLAAVRQVDYTDSPWASTTGAKKGSGLMQSGGNGSLDQGFQQTGGPGINFGFDLGDVWNATKNIGGKSGTGAARAEPPKYDPSAGLDFWMRGGDTNYGGGDLEYKDYWDQFYAGGSQRTDRQGEGGWSEAAPNPLGENYLGTERGGGGVDDEAMWQQGGQRTVAGGQTNIPFRDLKTADFVGEAVDPDSEIFGMDDDVSGLGGDEVDWEDQDPESEDFFQTEIPDEVVDDVDEIITGTDAQEKISKAVYDAPDYESAINNLTQLIDRIPQEDAASRTAAFQAIGQLYLESVRQGADLEAERISANPFNLTDEQYLSEAHLDRQAPLDIATEDRKAREAQFAADQARLSTDMERDRANRLAVAEQGSRMAQAQVDAAKAQFNPFDLGALPGEDLYGTGRFDEEGKEIQARQMSGPQHQAMLARGGLSTDERLAEIRAQAQPEMINSILGLLGNPSAMGALQGLFGGGMNAEGQMQPMQNQNFPAIPTISSLRNSPESTLQFLQGLFGTQGVNPDQLQNLIKSVSVGAPGGSSTFR